MSRAVSSESWCSQIPRPRPKSAVGARIDAVVVALVIEIIYILCFICHNICRFRRASLVNQIVDAIVQLDSIHRGSWNSSVLILLFYCVHSPAECNGLNRTIQEPSMHIDSYHDTVYTLVTSYLGFTVIAKGIK